MSMNFGDFALVATDQTNARSILVMKDTENKTRQLADNLLMAVNGQAGDTDQFAEFIAKNVQLYKMRHGYELNPKAAANFTRRNLADYLRSRTPFQVNLMLVGFDKELEQAEIYYMDYLAAMVKVPYGAHGYGGFFTTALMDRKYRKDMTRDEAYALMQECIQEIHKRLIINLPKFQIELVDKDGIKRLDDITIKNLP